MQVNFEVIVAYGVGVLTPVLVGWFSKHLGMIQDDFEARLEEICTTVFALADLSCKYWENENPPTSMETDVGTLASMEAKIVGMDFYIGALIAHLSEEFGALKAHLNDGALFDFSDAIMGGNFQVIGRKCEFGRGQRIQRAAYVLCVELRKARRDSIFPPRVFTQLIGRPR